MSPRPPLITSATKQVLIILVAGVGALLVLGIAALYGVSIWTGRAVIPESVKAQVWTIVTGLLVVGSTAIMTYVSSKNAERSRQNANVNAEQVQAALGLKVEAVGAALHDGIKNDFAAAAADLVQVNADKTAATLVTTLAASDAQKAADAAAQKTRDEITALHAKLDALLASGVPVGPSAPALVLPAAPGLQANTAQLAEATAATTENTSATMADTQVRLTVLEEASEKPKDTP